MPDRYSYRRGRRGPRRQRQACRRVHRMEGALLSKSTFLALLQNYLCPYIRIGNREQNSTAATARTVFSSLACGSAGTMLTDAWSPCFTCSHVPPRMSHSAGQLKCEGTWRQSVGIGPISVISPYCDTSNRPLPPLRGCNELPCW